MEAFGEFIDVVSEAEIESKYLRASSLVMQKMGYFYDSEKKRVDTFFQEVSSLFPGLRVHDVQSGVQSDATISVQIDDCKYNLASWEVKNEMKDISSEPNIQNMDIIFDRGQQRSPMPLISVVGCYYLQVFGAAWNGGQVCVDPLCRPVSLLFLTHDPMHGI